MRNLLPALRAMVEAIIGLVVLLTVPFSILKDVRESSHLTTSYLLGNLFGVSLMTLLAVLLLGDAVRVFKRRNLTAPSAPSDTNT